MLPRAQRPYAIHLPRVRVPGSVADCARASLLSAAMISTALDAARQRMAARPDHERIASHLQAQYGIEVSGLADLDLGVYRVERDDGHAWVARVFPVARPEHATAGDAEILELLQRHDFPAERAATAEPLSALDDQTVLVTEFVPGAPRGERAAAIRESGGLRRLGELLGELHSLPAADGAAARPGGAWHHLTDGGPDDEIRAIQALLAERADAASADEPQFATLARELAEADGGDGLPTALIHPDFALANVVASPERGMVLVDWAGSGRGPRAWPLAFLLYIEAMKNPARVGLVVSGYRRRVTLEPAEIERIPAMMWVRPLVLASWSLCLDRCSGDEAVSAAMNARELARTVGPQVIAAFQTPS
jgi:Ser/Thr protein kinase RdoA (MazF antagonist)